MGAAAGSVSGHCRTVGSEEPTTRQALGRIARLGDLYDATTDKFCKISIFREQLPPDFPAVSKTDNPHSNCKLNSVSSFEEKFRDLNIDGELKLSVLAGMCELGGSAEYLNQEKNSYKSLEHKLIYCIKTVTEHLEIRDERVKPYISEDQMGNATHVVIEIEWGANCVITYRDENRENKNKNEIQVQGRLSLAFKNVWSYVSWLQQKAGSLVAYFRKQPEGEPQAKGQAEPDEKNQRDRKKKEEKSSVENTENTGKPLNLGGKIGLTHEKTDNREGISVEIVGDVLPDEFPQTLEDAQETMKKLPELVKKSNGGKGKPVAYVMLPLSAIASRKLSQRLKTFTSVDDARMKKIVRLFDHMTALTQKVYDQVEELRNPKDHVTSRELEEACRLANDIKDHQASVQHEFKQLLMSIRTGTEDVGRLDAFCDEREATATDKFHECKKCYKDIQARIAEH